MRRTNPDISLRDLERQAIQHVELYNDWMPFLQWVDLSWKHGTPLGRLLRLYWMTEASPHEAFVEGPSGVRLEPLNNLESVYRILKIPFTRGPKIPPTYHAVHVYEGIEIPVRASGRAQRTFGPGDRTPAGRRRRSQFGHRVNVVCPICGNKGIVSLGRIAQHLDKHLPRKIRRNLYGKLQRLWGQSRWAGWSTDEPTYREDIDFGPVEVYVPKIEVG